MELNSEQNHDDYCLAYVFTDRDFDDGVLGLAWVGAPSGEGADWIPMDPIDLLQTEQNGV